MIERTSLSRLAYAWAVVALSLTGCGDDRIGVHPVSGSVTYQGQPAAGADVALIGEGDELQAKGVPVPRATTDAEGKFQLTSFQPGDGAPAGDYGVIIFWNEVVEPSDDPEKVVKRDRLKGRYATVESSKLKATVAAEANQLPPFELE